MLRTLGMTVTVLILFTASIQAANLFINPTFATNATGWTLSTTGCNDVAWDGSVGNPAGSVRLNNCGESTSDPFVSQAVSGLSMGNAYTVSVDVHLQVNSSGANGKSFGIFLDNEPNNPILLTEFLDNNWHTVSANFTATSATHNIFFAAELDARTPGVSGTSDVSYYVDNASLSLAQAGVPEPNMFWLLGGGLSVIWLLRRWTFA